MSDKIMSKFLIMSPIRQKPNASGIHTQHCLFVTENQNDTLVIAR